MIQGFETLTQPLNEHELLVAHELVPLLKRYVGESMAAKNTRISRGMEKHMQGRKGIDIKLPEARMRKILNHVRRHYLKRLCASEKGYYVARDINELLNYRESLRQRIGAIMEVFEVVDRECEESLKGNQQKMAV